LIWRPPDQNCAYQVSWPEAVRRMKSEPVP
jgi:hypothetical protein